MIPVSQNFGFLGKHDAQLERIAALAELYFSDDPIVSLVKLRLFGERLAQIAAARSGFHFDAGEPQADLLRRLRIDGTYPREVLDLFHQLRIAGNTAIHEHQGDHATALGCLKIARQLGIWYHRTFEDRAFRPGPFQPPLAPADATTDLMTELELLRQERDAALTQAQRGQAAAAEAEAARRAAESGARTAFEERALWEQLASDAEADKYRLAAELAALQSAAEASPRAKLQQVFQYAQEAAAAIDLDEADSLPDHNQSVATFALARLGFGDYRALDFLRTKMQDGRAQNSPLASYVEPHSHRGTASGSISVDPSSHTGRAYGLDVQIPPY